MKKPEKTPEVRAAPTRGSCVPGTQGLPPTPRSDPTVERPPQPGWTALPRPAGLPLRPGAKDPLTEAQLGGAEHLAGIWLWHTPSSLWLQQGTGSQYQGEGVRPTGWGMGACTSPGLGVRRGAQQGTLPCGLPLVARAWGERRGAARWVADERQKDQQGCSGLNEAGAEGRGYRTQRAAGGSQCPLWVGRWTGGPCKETPGPESHPEFCGRHLPCMAHFCSVVS